ncbi:MAG: hypothetical protein ABFC96_03605 [Thermoguttaceae bacterium]
MWCRQCRQDVPALASADKQTYCCPRCGETVCAQPRVAAIQSDEMTPRDFEPVADDPGCSPEPAPAYDGWELGEQLRDIERALKTAKSPGRKSESPANARPIRLDSPHGVMPPHVPLAKPSPRRPRVVAPSRGKATVAATWLAVALGTIGFVCGGILLSWSLVAGRHELWTIGLPTALGGQILLLVGLVFQLDRLWRENREAAAKLDNVDEQLHDLKATTTLLGTAQGPAATTFYSHFAGGANPQLLLTDLKSQIDLLAIKIAQERS